MTPAISDAQLLRDHVGGSQAAFAEIVSRYADLVYSAAMRLTRDRHLAEDVTQATFLLLSQKAKSLGTGTVLAAWLHRASRYCAANALRMRSNRERHERRAAEMTAEISQPPADDSLAEMLDAAIGKLSSSDQKFLILRFFQGKSHEQVAAEFQLSPDAARKRVERALVKLRSVLVGLGVETSTGSLAVYLNAHAIQSAPKHLVVAISSSAASNSSITIAKGALKMIFWTKVKFAAACLGGVMLLSVGLTAAVVSATRPAGEPKDARTALVQLAKAIKTGDVDFIKTHIEAPTPGKQKVVDEQARTCESVAKFREAYGTAFGQKALDALPQMVGPTEIPPDTKVTENGDHAVVEFSSIVKIDMVRIDGVWKMAYSALAANALPMSDEQLAAYFDRTDTAMDQVTMAIGMGQYKTPADCLTALRNLTIQVAQQQVQAATQPGK